MSFYFPTISLFQADVTAEDPVPSDRSYAIQRPMELHGLWERHGNQPNTEKTMENSQENQGKLWENYGKTMKKHGNSIGKPGKINRKTMEKPRKTYGT